jgi:hypothetical protein
MNAFFRNSLLVLVGGSMICFAAEPPGNLVMNGAFEAGNQYWHGDGKVVTLPDGNKVYQIEATPNKEHKISQEFRLHGLKEIEITFRARGQKYKGSGLRIALHRPGGGSVFSNREIPEGDAWTTYKMKYTQSKAEDQRTLNIIIHEGSGIVQIDDIQIREAGQAVVQNDPPKPSAPAKPGAAQPAPAPAPAIPAPAVASNSPVVANPLPAGTIGSLEQVLDSVPASTQLKFRDPATQEQAVAEMNDYFAKAVKGRKSLMKLTVEKAADFDGSGRKYYRLKIPDNAVGPNQPGIKLLWFFVYVPKENMLDPSATVPPGSQVTVSGNLTRCDIKNVGGWRLHANLSDARIEH